MPDLDLLATLRDLQDEFAASIALVDPDAPVAACPAWRVRSLVVHVSRVHHWAAGRARRRRETPLGRGPFDLAELYATCAAELRDTFAELDPDTPAWTLVGPGPVRFWHRRQVHETLVHLWDLRDAGGLDVRRESALWSDTIDEVVTVMAPRQVRLGRTPPPAETLVLVADDDDRAWLVGPTTAEGGPLAGPAATVSAPARELALLLWSRRPLDGLSVEGDEAAARRVLTGRLTP